MPIPSSADSRCPCCRGHLERACVNTQPVVACAVCGSILRVLARHEPCLDVPTNSGNTVSTAKAVPEASPGERHIARSHADAITEVTRAGDRHILLVK